MCPAHPLRRQILQIGGRLGTVQSEPVGRHPAYEPDGPPGVALVRGDGGDPVADGAAAQVRLELDASDGDPPDHPVVGEDHARPDRTGAADPRRGASDGTAARSAADLFERAA
jgi:hypothetical protein